MTAERIAPSPRASVSPSLIHTRAAVSENLLLADRTYRVRLHVPQIAVAIRRGQFLMIRLADTTDPLLGRPFALYDTVLVALGTLEKERTRLGDSVRYGIVVLSDGQDTNSRASLTQLEARLRPTERDPTSIQIHTIAIGADADENVLKKIASSAHDRFWKGQMKDDMVKVYQNIATYY